MNVLVLHGSPKGEVSVTYQHVRYMMKVYPQYNWDVAFVSHQIKQYREDQKRLSQLEDKLEKADFIIWSTPVYYYLVPAQYQEFIELIFSKKYEHRFRGKPASIMLTSIHFYDDTCRDYLHKTIQRLGMDYRGFFSARSGDILRPKGRKNFENYLAHIFDDTVEPVSGEKVLIVREDSGALDRKVQELNHHLDDKTTTVSIDDYFIKYGCSGCTQCGQDHRCIFHKKDDHHLLVQEILKYDAVFFVMSNPNVTFSAKWKYFFDRTYYKNHTPIFDKQIFSFVTEKPADDLLRRVLNAYAEFEHCVLGGVASTDQEITCLVRDVSKFSQQQYRPTRTFLGIGGHKIFRDEIWANLRLLYRADHLYYKKHGLYDFPRYRTRLRDTLLVLLFKIPGFKKKYQRNIKRMMISIYQRLFKD